jgi:hypothetical protein
MSTINFPELPTHLQADPEWAAKGVLLFRQALSEEQQKQLYDYIIAVSSPSKEYEELANNAVSFMYSPWPILHWNQIYTRESNITRGPLELLSWFQEVFENSMKSVCNVPMRFDSVYGQLYPNGGGLKSHKDVGIDWGGSISLGGASDLELWIGSEKLVLHQQSGDIVLANFGEIEHAVVNTNLEESPEWWKNSEYRHHKARCNIQLRDTSRLSPEIAAMKMSHEGYMKYIQNSFN